MDKLQEYREMEVQLGKMAKILKCGIFEVAEKVEAKLKRIKMLEVEARRLHGWGKNKISNQRRV